jgi:hypothetical protein
MGASRGSPKTNRRLEAFAARLGVVGAERSDAIYDTALELVTKWRVSVVPVHRVKGDKPPALKDFAKYHERLPGENDIRDWFAMRHDVNIGVLHGPASGGLCSRDFDAPDLYARWCDRYPDVAAKLPAYASGRRGHHVWFWMTPMAQLVLREECRKPGGTGAIPIDGDGSGELQIGRCYSVAPPSIHGDTGRNYEWVRPLEKREFVGNPIACGLTLTAEQLRRVAVPVPGLPPAALIIEPKPVKPATPKLGVRYVTQTPRAPTKAIELDAIDPELRGQVERAVERSAIRPDRRRHHSTFHLARELWSIPELRSTYAAIQLVPILRRWYFLNRHNMKEQDPEKIEADFLEGYANVRWPVGGKIAAALERSKRRLPSEAVFQWPHNPRLIALASFCRELQVDAGDGSFYLSAYEAEKRLGGPSAVTYRGYLKLLCAHGYLERTKEGNRYAAAYYRYLKGLPDEETTPRT